MRKILYHTLVIFLYNTLLLIIPIFIFLVSLSWANKILFDKLPLIFSLLVVFSPILTVVLGYRSVRGKPLRIGWPISNHNESCRFLAFYVAISIIELFMEPV